MMEPPTDGGPPYGSAATHRLKSEDVPCLRCGYNLRGLKIDGNCPECGSPIEQSLQGNLLAYSSPDYLATLHFGLILIIAAMLTLLLGGLSLFPARIAVELIWPDEQWLVSLISNSMVLGKLAVSLVSVIGWWLFSTPDYAILGHDTGDTPRKILRVAIIVSAAFVAIDAIGEWWLYQYVPYDLIAIVSTIVGGIAWLVQFFASLLYIRWLAYRLPSNRIVSIASLYLWLLPLIYIVGFCIVFLGPLVATVMYLILLNDIRRALHDIRKSAAACEM